MRRSSRLQRLQDPSDHPFEGDNDHDGKESDESGAESEFEPEHLIHLAEVGDRYAIPDSEFEHGEGKEGDEHVTRYGVVSRRERGTTLMWFDGDGKQQGTPEDGGHGQSI